MINKLKNTLFVVCIVMVFTAQSNRPQDEKEHVSNPARSQQVQPRRISEPQQVIRRESPPVEVRQAQPSHQERTGPRVYAVAPSAPVENNRLLHRQHHKNWQPRYNFYDNQYHFYPYVTIASLVELTTDGVTVMLDGQAYYYDQGTFYEQDDQGYLAIAPPIGIIVPALPPNAREINIDGQIYYRYKGVFYIQVDQGFQVVGPVESDTVEP